MKSLRWRIVLLLVGLVLGAIFITSWMIDRTLDRRFQLYLRQAFDQRREELSQALSRAYRIAGGWECFLSHPSSQLWLRSVGVVRLTDASGRLLFRLDPLASPPMFHRRHGVLGDIRPLAPVPVRSGRQKVGTAWIFGPPTRLNLQPRDSLFRRSIRRAIVLSSFFAGLIALVIGLFGAEYLTRPIRELTHVARRLAGGDLKARSANVSSDEIGELAGTLNHLAAELERGEERRNDALADTAHELRTPLTTIQSHLEAMSDGILEPSPENIKVVLEEVSRLTRLTEALQSFSLVERFRRNPNRVPVDLKFVLRQTEERLGPLFQRKGIALKIIVPDKPVFVLSHGQALQQILDNLLMNAAKYTPEQDGREVVLELTVNGNRAVLRIKDQGIGIPTEDLPHIFERFYRVDPSRSRQTGGVGLGLAIARETAEAVGGNLDATSRVGEGSVFVLTLPLA